MPVPDEGHGSPFLTVNGDPITDAEIRAETAMLRADLEREGSPLTLEQRMSLREEAIDILVERVLLYQEAARLKIAPSAAEIGELAATLAPRVDGEQGCRAGTDQELVRKEAERRLTLDRIIENWCRNLRPPKSTEVRNYYQSHQATFQRPEIIRAAHIVKHHENADREANRALLELLRERLVAREDFAVLAAEYSDCPEKSGDLGLFARGVMVEEFDDAVFDSPVGELTPVFETRFGFHLAVVRERRPAGLASLNEVAVSISDGLMRVKKDEEVGRRLKALHQSAKVQVLR